MKSIVTEFVNKHQLLTKGATVVIGVSGGPDSMALLHFYLSIQKEWNLTLVAIAVDHQLRGAESKADVQYVQKVCEKWNVKFVGASLDVIAYKDDKHVGTLVAAREVRYRFFAEKMVQYNADYLALGHHADDQIETMLMGFARSTSPRALSGIPVKRKFASGYIVRPLLCVVKKQIIYYCQVNQITPRIDPTNEDVTYTRNNFRKHLIPIIKKTNSNIHNTVQRLSETLQEDERFLQTEARKMVQTIIDLDRKKEYASFEIDIFTSYPKTLQRRAYQLTLKHLYEDIPGNLSYVHEEIFFTLLEEKRSNVHVDFPRHLKVEKSYGHLRFSFKEKNTLEYPFHESLHIPGEVNLPDGAVLTAMYTDDPNELDDFTYSFVADEAVLPIHVRTRQAGDRMSWKGLNGSKKIKDIFIDAKVPRKDRDTWPLITDNEGKVLWLIGLRKDRQAIEPKESLYIQLDYVAGNS